VAHLLSTEDREFQTQFDSCEIPPAEFNHRAHLRLAYVYLTQHDADKAHRLMRDALKVFIE
jgi:Tfp pilus assembly protein PilF